LTGLKLSDGQPEIRARGETLPTGIVDLSSDAESHSQYTDDVETPENRGGCSD
jgi:hypothetical protein